MNSRADLSSVFEISGRNVGEGCAPFIIAEMSGNHNGSLERALHLVDLAAAAGVDALKIQTFTADTMTLDLRENEFWVADPKSLWYGKSLYELYQKASTPWDWHERIFARCREKNIIPFSTPFDATAVDLLESLGAPCYTIASFENVDLPLIARVAKTGKPVLISTGMATEEEIAEAVGAAREAGCKELLLMKCCSSYPARPEEMNLSTIPALRRRFGCPVGLSDHTLGIGAAVASVACGAAAIEKHFTSSRKEEGVDAEFSMEPQEMAQLAAEAAVAWKAMGNVHFGPTERERASLQFRRSLYIVEDAPAGAELSTRNTRAIRPGLGLPPKHLQSVLGKRLKRAVKKGTPLDWGLLEQ